MESLPATPISQCCFDHGNIVSVSQLLHLHKQHCRKSGGGGEWGGSVITKDKNASRSMVFGQDCRQEERNVLL